MSDIALRNHFSAMARNSAWSNFRLLSACEQLTEAEFAQERTSFFPSIQLTLNHNLIVDHIYMADMIGKGRRNIDLVGDIPYSKASDLKQAQTEFDSSLIGFCDDIEPEDLDKIVSITWGTGDTSQNRSTSCYRIFLCTRSITAGRRMPCWQAPMFRRRNSTNSF